MAEKRDFEMFDMDDVPNVFDVNDLIKYLQQRGIELKKEIARLPDSITKGSLLLSPIEKIKLCKLNDFYLLQGRIEIMVDVVKRDKRCRKILQILKNMVVVVKKIIRNIKTKIKNN